MQLEEESLVAMHLELLSLYKRQEAILKSVYDIDESYFFKEFYLSEFYDII